MSTQPEKKFIPHGENKTLPCAFDLCLMKRVCKKTFASSRPINTARDYYGRYHFLLQVANPDVVIYVPNKDAKKQYKEIIKLEPGKYSDCVESSNLYYEVKENEFPDRNKNIKVYK